ncbi:unnamed protein product [Arabis nemorensis]|uniref:Uncharacterized protein n=1 Tax=Arabis nemorensis TaxID=586526 RepID=A0A565AV22_9BRAS|nr:unnamed protein product [Arabis nemorensis]
MSAHYRSPLGYYALQLERSSDALYSVYQGAMSNVNHVIQTLKDLAHAVLPHKEVVDKDGAKAE